MNNIMVAKKLLTDVPSNLLSTSNQSGEAHHTKYLDKEYITRARAAEVKQHLHSIGNLQRKMEKLASELAWELEQHHSKIHELYQLEAPFRKEQETTPVKVKTHKKPTTRAKNRQASATPIIDETLCASVA